MSSMKKKFNKSLFECDVVSKYSIRRIKNYLVLETYLEVRKLRALKDIYLTMFYTLVIYYKKNNFYN